jgi:hypothetical protein
MAKPVTPQEMFDLWQKMVNPGAYPLQSLMFPVLDADELARKIGELETVEHWLKANLNMLQLTIKSLEFQKSLVAGGEKAAAAMSGEGAANAGAKDLHAAEANPALWAWNMMAQAGRDAVQQATKATAPAVKRRKSKRAG